MNACDRLGILYRSTKCGGSAGRILWIGKICVDLDAVCSKILLAGKNDLSKLFCIALAGRDGKDISNGTAGLYCITGCSGGGAIVKIVIGILRGGNGSIAYKV